MLFDSVNPRDKAILSEIDAYFKRVEERNNETAKEWYIYTCKLEDGSEFEVVAQGWFMAEVQIQSIRRIDFANVEITSIIRSPRNK